MQHVAVLWNGAKVHWRSEPGFYRTRYDEALAIMRERLPNANIRLELAQ